MTAKDRRTILRKIPYGLYVLTSRLGEQPVATTVSFVTQTSLEPPLVTIALKQDSTIYRAFSEYGLVALHFIPVGDTDMAGSFFKSKDFDDNQINGYKYKLSDSGLPLLEDSPMILELELIQSLEIGDHHPFIGAVVNTHLRADEDILTISQTNWHYGG